MVKNTIFGENYKHVKSLSGVTSRGGLVLFQRLAFYAGLPSLCKKNLGVKTYISRYSDFHYIWSMVLGLLAGCNALSDYIFLKSDKALSLILGGWEFPSVSSLSKYLWKANYGHVLQIEKLNSELFQKSLTQRGKLTIVDIDGTLVRVSHRKQGSRVSYLQRHGYHLLLSFLYDTAELIKVKLMKGSDSVHPKIIPFIKRIMQILKKLPKEVILRMDAGFYSNTLIEYMENEGFKYVLAGQKSHFIKNRLASIPEKDWKYYAPRRSWTKVTWKLQNNKGNNNNRKYYTRTYAILRVERDSGENLDLFDGKYKYFLYLTNLDIPGDKLIDFYHKRGNVENYIKEFKSGIGIKRFPNKRFNANALWLQICQLAYNMMIWIQKTNTQKSRMYSKSIRFRLINIPLKFIRPQNRPTLCWSKNTANYDQIMDTWNRFKIAA